MADPLAPKVETRRAREFAAELLGRARTWLPEWNPDPSQPDAARALFEVSARLLAQVAERLDRVGEKNRRNLYAWLGLRGLAARGARLPVVFKLTDSATASVLARAPVQLQADAAGTSLTFETDTDLMLVPAQVALVAAVDPDHDAYYLPGEPFASLAPAALLPARWEVVSLAANGSAALQLDPPLGLAPGMILSVDDASGAVAQFRITAVDADIVTIAPKIDIAGGIAAGSIATRVDAFAPFDGSARSRQLHALYFGDADLFNIETTARIAIAGANALASGFAWQYWGKVPGSDTPDWQKLVIVGADADPAHPNALVLEKQSIGAVEAIAIGGASSRWLRASTPDLPDGALPLALGSLKVSVGSAAAPARPVLEGLANTNPLVLDSAFLPLGREPRQFDAFYLACNEVFAKHGATVQLEFTIADSSFASLSTPRTGDAANQLVAGIGHDQSLHLLRFDPTTGAMTALAGRDALQPPDAGVTGRAPLQSAPVWRVPVWEGPFGQSVIVAAVVQRTVWLWLEAAATTPFTSPASRWLSPPGTQIAPPGPAPTPVDALVHVQIPDSAGFGTLFALYGGALYTRPALATGSAWQVITPTPANVKLAMLAPVVEGSGGAPPTATGTVHLIGVDSNGGLVAVHDGGQLDTLLPAKRAASDVQPIALRTKTFGHVIVVVTSPADPAAMPPIPGHIALTAVRIVGATISSAKLTLPAAPSQQTTVGFDFDDGVEGSTIVVTVTGAAGSRLLWWTPDYTPAAPQSELLDAPLAPSAGTLSGTPLRMPHHVLVPGQQASVFKLPLLTAGSSGSAPIQLRARLPMLTAPLAAGDLVTVASDGINGLAAISSESPAVVGGPPYVPLTLATTIAAASLPATMVGFRIGPAALGATFEHAATNRTDILLDDADALDNSTRILVDAAGATPLFTVVSVTKNAVGTKTRAVLGQALPPAVPDPFTYRPSVDLTGASIDTVIRFDLGGAPTISPPGLAKLLLEFDPPADPKRRRADVLTRLADARPATALLESAWTTLPPNVAGEYDYTIAAAPGDWTQAIGVTTSNPELSWEYSNGRSWWRLQPGLIDGTTNLTTSGTVKFDVPADIVQSDWAGRSNFWIRARLVGGDFGREVFTVTATVVGNVTTQTVKRSTEGIRAPVVAALAVKYTMHDAVYPAHVFAEDAGTFRNQSDANRTPGAEVEAFVPLAVELARLSNGSAGSGAAAGTDTACGCVTPPNPCIAGTSEVRPAGGSVAATEAGSSAALLIGIDGVAAGAPVHLLIAVGEERNHDAAAPLKVEALVGGRFEPVVASDATRAIGESGIVTMAIAHAPSVTELFGRSLSWLRLAPANASMWKPSLAGVWLNAAWVEAAQTQTREVLGSSQGAPGMLVTLARPPLLHDTLELRVNEPLGEEEVAALRSADATAVLTDVDGLPGIWVRWHAVGDVADAAAGERVYALDEASGDLRFGDGLAGMIPPIGRDNIVAFSYRRTEPLKPPAPDAPLPQVAIAARSPLALVTPLDGVESAIAALDSDAGAPADDAQRVLRFAPAQLRHRGRALSPADVEALALQALPAIAQARCLRSGNALRLVVVMRGRQIAPARAVQRELERLLLQALPAGFGATGSARTLLIAPPKARRLRVQAALRVASLDIAGAVADRAKQALQQRFDPATGADDGLGWPLGSAPDAREVAAALIDIEGLDGIDELTLLEASAAGETAWPATLAADELAVLPDDGLDFSYRPIGVVA